MKKIRNFLVKNMNGVIASFALAFAIGASEGICFYIFHQPKMPKEVMKLNEK